MNIEQAKSFYLDSREKMNAFSLCFYLNSLDIETGVAPRKSMEYRSRQLSVIQSMIYDMNTSEEFTEAVRILFENSGELDADLAREVTLIFEQSEKLRKIPKDEYIEYSNMLNSVYPVYVEAKTTNNFSLFEPYLQKIIDYNRKYVEWVGEDTKRGYDVLLDEYERGYNREQYDRFFELLKEKIVPLVKKISGRKLEYNDSFVGKTFPKAGQVEFCEYLRSVMKFDPERTAILESEHPFTANNGNTDVRITNHYYEDNVVSAIFSAIHEMGHGLYELQIDDKYEGTGLSGGASLAIHESQSRFMENMIGRSLPFWETHFGKLKSIFPEQFEGVSALDFYKHVNTVEPSLIRTEADELTYSLHVIIRYEIEKEMMAGTLAAKDVPEVWNRKYKEYLGVDVPSDREGCLQDMHWSGGGFGYFPTYSLGSAYAAQIYDAMSYDIDIDEEIRSGELGKIALWLRDNLHKYGSSKFPKELIKLATGASFNPDFYVDYLVEKYTKLYNLA